MRKRNQYEHARGSTDDVFLDKDYYFKCIQGAKGNYYLTN